MMESSDHDLAAAVLRAERAIDLASVCALLDEVPERASGHVLVTPGWRAVLKRQLQVRYEYGIVRAAERVRAQSLA